MNRTAPRNRITTSWLATVMVTAITALTLMGTPVAQAESFTRYQNLPLTNRLGDKGPGGVNSALPHDKKTLAKLVNEARASGQSPTTYAALLYQYRLVQATSEAGIDLKRWNPRNGFPENRPKMIKSYRYYENFQLNHRELQWAGMAGLVGSDFGGGIADMNLATDIYSIQGLQPFAGAIINQVVSAFGKKGLALLPAGLKNLATKAGSIQPKHLRWFINQILIMQKAIFTDLMPMHYIYVHEGIKGIDEFYDAGLIPTEIRDAWYDVASGDHDRISTGNAALLRREQFNVVGQLFDDTRNYANGIGEALTFAMTLIGQPSIAGVPPLRNFKQVTITSKLQNGRTATLKTPIPDWNWSIFEQRWQYVTTELLPRYKRMVEHQWSTLSATMRVPYETQFETHRAIYNIPKILDAMLKATKLTVK